MKTNNVKNLWSLACSGDIDSLREYYESGGDVNLRYNRFNTEYSLIMGALSNRQYDTIDYLLSVGETVTDEEFKEIEYLVRRQNVLREIYKSYQKHSKGDC